MSTELSVSTQGWIPSATSEMRSRNPLTISVSGNDAILIVGKIGHIMDRLPFHAFPGIPKIVIGGEYIDPLIIPLFLGALGSLGAAGACLSYVLGLAHAVKYKISVAYDAKDPYTLLDDRLVFNLIP